MVTSGSGDVFRFDVIIVVSTKIDGAAGFYVPPLFCVEFD
jgi:hypothetical protein